MSVKNDLRLLSVLLQKARPYRLLIFLSILLISVDVFFQVAVASVQEYFINVINDGLIDSLRYYVHISAILSVFFFIFLITGQIIRILTTFYIERDLAYQMVEHMNSLSFDDIRKIHSGDIASRINNDAYFYTSCTMGSFYNVLLNAGMFILAFFYLSSLDLKLTILALVSGPIVFAAGRFFDKKIRVFSKKAYKLRGELRGKLQEILQGIETIRSFNLQKAFYENYKTIFDKYTEYMKKNSLYSALMFQSIFLVNMLIRIIVTYLVSLAAVKGDLSIGASMAFLILMNRLQWPFINLSYTWGTAQAGFAAADRVFEFLSLGREEEEREIDDEKDKDNNENDEALEGDYMAEGDPDYILEFDDVYFSYQGTGDEGEVLFSGLSFRIRKGEFFALVGPSGAGKSSLARLACGLYYPQKGVIKIMGIPVRGNLSLVRSYIAYVPQTPYLFTGTIRENIAYGADNPDEEDIIRAARAANAHDFIMDLENGYDTRIGEQGSSLSGGEKQRISIARAFIRNAPLLILDEATSALDNKSEKLVQESMEKLVKNRTALVIAHRLSTIRNADRIMVLDKGRIVEMGTHEELLAKGNIYATLFKHQFN